MVCINTEGEREHTSQKHAGKPSQKHTGKPSQKHTGKPSQKHAGKHRHTHRESAHLGGVRLVVPSWSGVVSKTGSRGGRIGWVKPSCGWRVRERLGRRVGPLLL